MLTQEKLKEYVNYCPKTGVFTWIKKRKGSKGMGSIAGDYPSHKYAYLCLNYKKYYLHRLAWLYVYGEFPKKPMQIDHKNHNTKDNRIENLRIVTPSENLQNRIASPRHSYSKMLGVGWCKKRKKWRARINIGGKDVHLGYFDREDEAHQYYMKEKANRHKSFIANY